MQICICTGNDNSVQSQRLVIPRLYSPGISIQHHKWHIMDTKKGYKKEDVTGIENFREEEMTGFSRIGRIQRAKEKIEEHSW